MLHLKYETFNTTTLELQHKTFNIITLDLQRSEVIRFYDKVPGTRVGGANHPPGCEVSIGSASCLILTSGQRAPAAVLLAAGCVGEATVLAMEAGTGGDTAMLAGIMAESTARGWEEGGA